MSQLKAPVVSFYFVMKQTKIDCDPSLCASRAKTQFLQTDSLQHKSPFSFKLHVMPCITCKILELKAPVRSFYLVTKQKKSQKNNIQTKEGLHRKVHDMYIYCFFYICKIFKLKAPLKRLCLVMKTTGIDCIASLYYKNKNTMTYHNIRYTV